MFVSGRAEVALGFEVRERRVAAFALAADVDVGTGARVSGVEVPVPVAALRFLLVVAGADAAGATGVDPFEAGLPFRGEMESTALSLSSVDDRRSLAAGSAEVEVRFEADFAWLAYSKSMASCWSSA